MKKFVTMNMKDLVRYGVMNETKVCVEGHSELEYTKEGFKTEKEAYDYIEQMKAIDKSLGINDEYFVYKY